MSDSSAATSVPAVSSVHVPVPPAELLQQTQVSRGCLANIFTSVGRTITITDALVEVTENTIHKKKDTGVEFSIMVIGDQYSYAKIMVSGVHPTIIVGNWYTMTFTGKVNLISAPFQSTHFTHELSVNTDARSLEPCFTFADSNEPSARVWPEAHLRDWLPSTSTRIPNEQFSIEIKVCSNSNGLVNLCDLDETLPKHWLQLPTPSGAVMEALNNSPLIGSCWKLRGIASMQPSNVRYKDGNFDWATVSLSNVVWIKLLRCAGSTKRQRDEPEIVQTGPVVSKKSVTEHVATKK